MRSNLLANYSQEQDVVIEEALNRYELAPLPPSFVSQVMAQVEMAAVEFPPVRFQLDFVDWAIPTFAAAFTAVLLFILNRWDALANGGLIRAVSVPDVINSFQPNALFLIGIIVVAEIFIAAVVAVWLWNDRSDNRMKLN